MVTMQSRHSLTCAAPADVKRWLDNPEGIAGWWSDRWKGRQRPPGTDFTSPFQLHPWCST
jgi:hypothetical protein